MTRAALDTWTTCTCGHYRGEHVNDAGRCKCLIIDMTGEWQCICKRFKARAK